MALDFRETAPRKATKNMYIIDGKLREDLSREGVLSSGVPGIVAGVLQAHMLFGETPIKKLLQPVVDFAEKGFEVYPELAYAIEVSAKELIKDPSAAKIFFKEGKPLKAGELLVRKDLAKTIGMIAKKGKRGFYSGEIAKKIVEDQVKRGGLISRRDLSRYQVKMRNPVKVYRGEYQIYSMPPPSSGGTGVIAAINMLSDMEAPKAKDSTMEAHMMATTLQKVFADRAEHMGDSDYVRVPYRKLSSKRYAKQFVSSLDLKSRTSSKDISPDLWKKIEPDEKMPESSETTHFSMMDKKGNMISSTQTINGYFGAKYMVPGTGIVMNNQMNDFSIAVGQPNLFKSVGSEANAVRALKRPLSSMSPTLVLHKWMPKLALGTPSGTRIISCVINVLYQNLYKDKDLYESVSALRFHHQWYPDEIRVEPPGFDPQTKAGLQKLGYKLNEKDLGCKISAVERLEDKTLRAVSDPRGFGFPAGVGEVRVAEVKK